MSDYGFAYLKNLNSDDDAGLNDDIAAAAEAVKPDFAESIEEVYKSNENGLGFPVSENPGTYDPQTLNARHREILRLVALGYKYTQVARILGITPTTVGYTVNSPLGTSFLQEIHEARTSSVKDVHNRLQEMSPFAAEVVLDIMADGKSENNRLRAAEKVLEMTGHKSENKHMHLHTHMTPEEIAEIKRTAHIGPKTVSEDSEEGDPNEIAVQEETDE